MKRTLIRVTEKHITDGNHISDECPIAIAIKAETGKIASVVCDVMFFSEPSSGLGVFKPTSKLSTRALRWRRAFDNRKPVKPFRFYLMVP